MKESRWTARQGREVVRQWERSGQSMSAFTRERGWNVQRLRYWRERAEEEAGKSNRARAPKEQRGYGLVPAVVVGTSAESVVRVLLPFGVTVEASSVGEVSATWVAEMLRALGGER